MSPDDWTDGRLDDLAAQVRALAAVSTLVATHAAKIDGVEDDVKALRDMHRDFVTESRKVLEAFNVSCETRVARVERKVDELTRAQRWTPGQLALVIAPTIAAVASIAVALISGGGGG